jgi:hypothetical protein
MAPNLYSVDLNGIDYKFGLDDIPAFWKPYIKRIEIADGVDLNELNFARDQHFIELASSGLIGGTPGAPIPREWIVNHLITK